MPRSTFASPSPARPRDLEHLRRPGLDVRLLVRPSHRPHEEAISATEAARFADDVATVVPTGPVGAPWQRVTKRAIDLTVGGLALLVVLPVLVVCLVAVRLDSKGPALFRQRRVGLDGRTFTILKVRTMTVDAEARRDGLLELNEADGPLFKITHDPRVTRLGRILRKLSLDELPQLVNVLRGDMSLVGPRPALPCEVAGWAPALHERLRVRPGITGLWQVSGRSDSSFEDYVRHDLTYVNDWCLAADLSILARTVPLVVLCRGAR